MASQYTPVIPHLHSINLSHYCEKVRWAFRRLNISYSEENHLPGFHLAANLARGGGRTTPCLFTSEGIIPDSTDILHWLDRQVEPEKRLFPDDQTREQVEALENRFDLNLGPHTRRYVYFYLLQDKPLCLKLLRQKGPAHEKNMLPFVWPALTAIMRQSMNITYEASQISLMKMKSEFDFVDQRLSDGRPYLCGDRFSAADLSFAALGAPIVGPAEYSVKLPELDELPPALAETMREFRQRPSGQKILKWFKEEQVRF
ncbi:glutathione S-transferase [bacterium (Candidatus Blackallbacteria) CG17_big_fil_post_rev_8_21_14_2_50_48_46]|uniref:Glutathione S-transferase n=1 Tax=bacterium (Candidatus Blackallbacteria) CG17_big_fil_post_rev_8_21_14_2_50_48_46 TaxID=2014261 RepID=A0A2M7G9D2_9BACT|nr:MAG: glutathione S-transferase [bacterium (Candidatus Blackallbacteria) CG18_big_fil_WC_8_21_14_2_50_49_26]PIW18464.1 MAG: glutathione S-transferase [bacterium (Candidatus Blackallbacteria) CG17_big_fil_post_rev_8_21_14_2_50_48_46]PIW46551.1 MAG: glutathione S-transferase [bacterium (Candidatus Blackallbacteria) CG13_big_fil_rev_8_21_14_2_50_49_14]